MPCCFFGASSCFCFPSCFLGSSFAAPAAGAAAEDAEDAEDAAAEDAGAAAAPIARCAASAASTRSRTCSRRRMSAALFIFRTHKKNALALH